MRTCEHCGGPLAIIARRHARFCSPRCRAAAHRAIPAELRRHDRWVRVSPRKVPLRPDGSGPASVTDRTTWGGYREVTGRGRRGFVLAGDGIVCLDLDHCLVGGRLVPWAGELLDQLPATYVERSMSGTGLHVWGRARLSAARVIRDGRHIEVYGTGRYIAVTGERWRGAPSTLADLSEVIAAIA